MYVDYVRVAAVRNPLISHCFIFFYRLRDDLAPVLLRPLQLVASGNYGMVVNGGVVGTCAKG